jgi:CxxC motif-containing protein
MICIECPKSCELSVDLEGCKVLSVKGAKCPKGLAYAAMEIETPSRIFTATVVSEGLSLKLVPVRTDRPIPKKDILKAAEDVRNMKLIKPVRVGDVIVRDFIIPGVKLLVTRDAE